jgi:hypothetical protein
MRIFVAFLFVSLFACNSNKVIQEEMIEVNTFEDQMIKMLDQECFEVRKTIKSLEDVEGKIIIIGDMVLIQVGETKRYQACEMPVAFKAEGVKIIFSADVKEIFQSERRAGTPIILTKLSFKN